MEIARWQGRVIRAVAARPFLVDSVLAFLAGALSVWAVFFDGRSWPLWTFVLAAATAAPLPWRRRAPFTVFVLSSLLSLGMSLFAHSAQPQIMLHSILVVYTLADRGKEWQRWLSLVVLVSYTVYGTHSPNGLIFSELTNIGSFILGSVVRELRQQAETQRKRAHEAGARAASEAARAVAEERSRIAREMHDILAHAVSLMVIQAEAGPLVVHRDPEKAIRAFDTIADSGRDAMVQLRRVLGVLKEDGATPQLAPQPRLVELTTVADRVRAAGVRVELALPEPVPALPADVEAAAYRIIQEALTNVLKHSGADRAEVAVVERAERLELTVQDNGRGPDGTAAVGAPGWSGGRGLLGIRERAVACGGRAEAGPGPDGLGFRIRADLPLGTQAL
ncbi:sensor histidine kinase [Kitasatospora acidiphila]|uniref:histidine kinase n=1 Tax=Kitasatospora acidiphila TaxID=2567942 RepID=A0A540W7M5_9ACTN|nr:histidine kinase [Kitasatospora acidiphila]TQF04993.1 sensor histidine kinase [Kitasatospora acidiphila]